MERYISQSLNLSFQAVANTLKLLAEGATIPFISRYRKEATGGLDEVQIAAINTAYTKLQELQKRKETVLSTIEEQGKLTDELRTRIAKCMDSTELEDIYLPYKPKRRTRTEVARTKGLEPLAKMLMAQNGGGVESMALRFVKGEVKDTDDAESLLGARLEQLMSDDKVWKNPRLSLADLAMQIGTNRTYLSNYLNSNLNTTFYDYINGYRIEAALRMMHEAGSSRTMAEVAENSGFNSISTFRRVFRRVKGCSFGEYRQRL